MRRRLAVTTEAARDDKLFGFCLATGGPGEQVCLDSFYIGKLKGVGKVYQLTAVDVFTRWAYVAIVLGPITGTHTVRFVDQLLRHYRRHGVTVRAVLSDNGPEYKATAFRTHLVEKGLRFVSRHSLSRDLNRRCDRRAVFGRTDLLWSCGMNSSSGRSPGLRSSK